MINSLLRLAESHHCCSSTRLGFICCPCVSINRVSINIPSLCICILSTKHKVIFCQQQQTTDHPFNDCSFILRSIEAPVVTLRHANEADCDNERWLVTTHRMPGVTPGTGRWAGRQREEQRSQSVSGVRTEHYRQDGVSNSNV
mgnify:CR=1 FL=1